jgi:hypothetical protein
MTTKDKDYTFLCTPMEISKFVLTKVQINIALSIFYFPLNILQKSSVFVLLMSKPLAAQHFLCPNHT